MVWSLSLGDGSLLATFLACRLISRTLEKCPSAAERVVTTQVFQRCLTWCTEHLQPAAAGEAHPSLVGRCKLDPGLKAPGFKISTLMKITLLSI